LFPFDPDRVLADVPQPPAKLTISKSNDVGIAAQDPAIPVPSTPVTPVTAQGLTSLQSLIDDSLEPMATRLLSNVVKLLVRKAD
jgi:hypothetical protein